MQAYYKISLRFYACLLTGLLLFNFVAYLTPIATAQPYGKGKYNENVPYGSQTQLTISTNGDVNIPLTPTDAGVLGTGNSVVTVTSTDVVGFKLYVRTGDVAANLVNGASQIPASANGSPAALATNTWGYNTDGSTNFVGLTTSDVLIKNAAGPYTSGNNTTVTYGVKIDNSKAAGRYAGNVLYTATPQTD